MKASEARAITEQNSDLNRELNAIYGAIKRASEAGKHKSVFKYSKEEEMIYPVTKIITQLEADGYVVRTMSADELKKFNASTLAEDEDNIITIAIEVSW